MAKEKKLALSGLPTVYATDVLKIDEIGALVVYTVTRSVSTVVDGVKKTQNEVVMDAINLRFSTADTPVSEDNKRTLTANIRQLLDVYLSGNTDVAPCTVIVGKVGYDWFYDSGMQMAIVKLKIGDVNLAEAHYLGGKPTADSAPSQIVYAATPGTVPPALSNTVANNLAAIINKELYGA